MLFVTDAGDSTGVTGLSAGVVGLTVNADCTLSVAWSRALGGNSYPNSTPTVANGVVYVGEGNGGLVHAYDARTGTELWNGGGSIGSSTFAAPSLGDGKVFVGSWAGGGDADGGIIRAFAPSSSPSSVTLLGDSTLEPNVDSNPIGKAEAFQATASASGTLASLWLYLDSTSTATKVVLGVYSDNGGHPGTLLAQGGSTALASGTFNKITVPVTQITAGTTYWFALLAPVSGTIKYRDLSHGPCKSESSSQTTLTTLPVTWVTGSTYTDCPVSGYGSTGS